MLMRCYINGLIRSFILATILLAIASPAIAQQDISSFEQTFKVFQTARDAYKSFDISAEDVIYGIPPAYKLGPGDVLQIIMTGMINDSLATQVGPQGDVYVPPAGLLKIEGMSVGEARDYIDLQLKKYLTNYTLAIQLLRARKMVIYLLGEVRQPGTYTTVAGTTALSVIQTAGALATNLASVSIDEPSFTHPYFRALTSGAGRRVEVYRKGELVGTLDLAKMAISGRAQDDLVLEDGDALFIPVNSKPVVVRGGVARPGTYEAGPDDTVLDLIAQAGGYKNLMMLDTVEVDRRNPAGSDTKLASVTLDLRSPSFDPKSFTFETGDIIRVPDVKEKVFVMGAVYAPQSIDYHEGWTVLDYLAAANGVITTTDTAHIRIISFPLTPYQTITPINFKNLILGVPIETIPIEPGDLIYVPWKNQPFPGSGVAAALTNLLGQSIGFARLIHDIQ
jgi:protein involved in polysaccharide export with SLBB domain